MDDDGSGHDYAGNDEHLSLSTVLHLFNPFLELLFIFTQTSESIFKCCLREKSIQGCVPRGGGGGGGGQPGIPSLDMNHLN